MVRVLQTFKMSRVIEMIAALCLVLIFSPNLSLADDDDKIHRLCVPHIFFGDCEALVKEPSQVGNKMECVSGRDRMECLEKVNRHDADVIAVDPEDMYVAYHMNNQDFHVISEIRTQVEKDAEFRYEGVILIKKSSPVHSLGDLKGRKSCHTGFGRNVGYKIPLTKLKNHGVLKVDMDPTIAPSERELKALSEFFSESCLVGTYSPQPEIDTTLKKRYPNLCALCEKPEQCNYPDKYSGYEGAIRCLAEGQGEVAFTKTSFIKKYFGLAGGSSEGNADDFEYLCEDGTRLPITGQACSWAQRPWQGYMTNSDTAKEEKQLDRLQKNIDGFYNAAKASNNKQGAGNLLIKDDLVLHEKEHSIMPKEYLEKAGYKDVIERDGSMTQKIRICVKSEIESQKCNILMRAAYSRDIRPEFECVLYAADGDCIKQVEDNNADCVILGADDYKKGRDAHLEPVAFESYADNDVHIAVVDASINIDKIKEAVIKYNTRSERARSAAVFLNHKLSKTSECPGYPSSARHNAEIEIVNAKDSGNLANKKILCPDLKLKDASDHKTCNIEATLPHAVFVRASLSENEMKNIVHGFVSVSDKFGHKGKLEEVFEVFGEYLPGSKDIIFSDDTIELVTEFKPYNDVNEELFAQLNCH